MSWQPRAIGSVTPPAGDEVQLWRVSLEDDAAALAPLLSDDERARAARYHFDRDRRRYVVGRARLRQLLGAALGVAATAVRFSYGARGKPAVDGLSFNLSNSADLALVAIARAGTLGVDLEAVRPDVDVEAIGQRFFSAPEREVLRALSPSLRADAFFRCWTRKEAYIKAVGDGLQIPLDAFAVRIDGPARLAWVRDDPDEPARWWMAHLDPGPGFAGALAVRDDGRERPLALYSANSPEENSTS